MSINDPRVNLYNTHRRQEMIDILTYAAHDPIMKMAPVLHVTENNKYNRQYNHNMDRLFLFRNNYFLESKSIYDESIWEINLNDRMGENHNILRYGEMHISTYPSTIYKLQKISFKNSGELMAVKDLYTFNIHDLSELFANCKYLRMCELDVFGPRVYEGNREVNLDYLFANCNQLVYPPNECEQQFWEKIAANDDKVTMNFAFYGTPLIQTNSFLLKHAFVVEKNGGNGIFAKSNLYDAPLLILDNVYELRNTFEAATHISNNRFEYRANIQNAVATDAMFKDCKGMSKITLDGPFKIKTANYMFEDNNGGVNDIYINGTVNVNEAIAMYRGAKMLYTGPTTVNFDNCIYMIDTFKDCVNLGNFYKLNLLNAKVTSGIYEHCDRLTGIKNILNSSDTLYMLSNSMNVSNLFKGCENLKNDGVTINLGATSGIEANEMFSGCSSLTSQVPINNVNNIEYSIGMYKDCSSISGTPSYTCMNSKDTSVMFSGCSSMTGYSETSNQSINSNGKFTDCTNMSSGTFYLGKSIFTSETFKNCSKMSSFNAASGGQSSLSTDVSSMFEGCSSLTTTPAVFNSTAAKNLTSTFKGCNKLSTINMSLQSAQKADGLFENCTSLANVTLTCPTTVPTYFPRLDFRGTNLSTTSLTNIANSLPNLSTYVSSGYSVNQNNFTFNTATDIKYDFTVGLISSSVCARSSSTIKLKPGRYKITNLSNMTCVNICKVVDDNTLYYMNGVNLKQIGDTIDNIFVTTDYMVDIDEYTDYYIYIYYRSGIIPTFTLTWMSPYHTINVYNTPCANTSNSSVSAAITTLNNKGWNLVSDTTLTGISNRSTTNLLQNKNIQYENGYWKTPMFSLSAGYYTLYDNSNSFDELNVMVYDGYGEYAIGMGVANQYNICFDNRYDYENVYIKFKIKNKQDTNSFVNTSLILNQL